MRRAARFFVGRRGWTARTLTSALAGFRLDAVAGRSGPWLFLDTFDARVSRAGFALVVQAGAMVLEDRGTGEAVGSVVTPAAVPRTADELRGSDVGERVARMIGPRALLDVARVSVSEREWDVSVRGSLKARVRLQAARVRGRRRAERTVRVVALIPTAADGRAHASRVREIARALGTRGFRPAPRGFLDAVFHAMGVRADAGASPPLALDGDAPLRMASAAIFARLLNTMRRNEAGMRDDVDPEFLHDYRVALRRTRTGLSQFRGALGPELSREYRARFARIAAATGRVRDLDVQLQRHDDYAAALPTPLRRGFEPVFAQLRADREAARETLLEVLAHPSHARLVRDWGRAVAGLARGPSAGLDAERPAGEAARSLVRRRYARVRRVARGAQALDDASLHRARIECKKLRYLLEFFAGILGPGAGHAIASLRKAQDALGEYNDVSTQIRELSTLVSGDGPEPIDSPLTAAAVGALIASLDERRRKLRSRCERRLGALDARKSRRAFERLVENG